jgi:predicted Zn-dependent protease
MPLRMQSEVQLTVGSAMIAVKKLLQQINQFMQQQGITGSVTYQQETSHMVRCGRSQISLNVSEQGEKYFIELQQGKRKIEGSTTAQVGELDKLKVLVLSLNDKLKFMPEVSHRLPMTAIAQLAIDENLDKNTGKNLDKNTNKNLDNSLDQTKVDAALLNVDSSLMVNLFKQCAQHFENEKVEISGAFSAGIQSYAVINTLVEQAVSYQGSDYNVEIVLQLLDHDKKELRVSDVGNALTQFDSKKLIEHLTKMYQIKTETPQQEIDPGEYDVIFYADAFADLTNYMGYLALHGESYEYGMGMLQKDKQKVGDKLFSENLSIIDDPTDVDILFSRPVGRNGIKRPIFPLISNGVLDNMFYSVKEDCDRFNVEINNDVNVSGIKVPTGTGPATFDEMVKSCIKPTLFISYIHYMNFTNAAKGEFTGTSRFGTFLIEQGEISAHLYNQRINDSFHNTFNNIEWLSSTLTHINTSNTYEMRNAASIACPLFVKVNKVKISGSNKPA